VALRRLASPNVVEATDPMEGIDEPMRERSLSLDLQSDIDEVLVEAP
jgi:hypothetical protein